jgi:hypothetical protein
MGRIGIFFHTYSPYTITLAGTTVFQVTLPADGHHSGTTFRLGGEDTGGILFDDVIEVINLTEDDKKFLETKEQQYTKEFLEKFTDNDLLYIHKNIFEPEREHNSFILFNIPED